MLILIPCPECGHPAEVADRFILGSTDGPVGHLSLRCTDGHQFRMPADALPEGSLAALQDQETVRSGFQR